MPKTETPTPMLPVNTPIPDVKMPTPALNMPPHSGPTMGAIPSAPGPVTGPSLTGVPKASDLGTSAGKSKKVDLGAIAQALNTGLTAAALGMGNEEAPFNPMQSQSMGAAPITGGDMPIGSLSSRSQGPVTPYQSAIMQLMR